VPILRRLDAPRRLVSSIEGEGPFNDATVLVAFRAAVAAVVAGSSRSPRPAFSSSSGP
jgi:NhaP-type Na+/H+ or K+/H+ antiporter